MRFDVRRLRALRAAHPVASLVTLATAGTVGLGAVATVAVLAGSSAQPGVRPAASPSPVLSAVTAPPSLTDLHDFQLLRRQGAGSAPIRRLPRVHLTTLTVSGIPPVPLTAYQRAAQSLAASDPSCHLRWWLLAGIGLVESGHAHSGGSTHAGWNGVARPPIYGPVLSGGNGFKQVADTDNGVFDGDKRWDRAVGPMQFLPSTWLTWGPAGHLDGHADPQNIFAAAKATAGYLCAAGRDLSQSHAMALAVYSYNHSFGYVRLVLSVGARYAGMTPDQLGVNLLPKDKPANGHKHRHHNKKQRKSRTSPRGTQRAGATTPSPTASPSTSPSPSPSPSSSSQPIPNPLPTLSPLILR